MTSRSRRSLLAVIGPGMLIAATGVGAGDLAGGAFAGSKLGLAVLWAIVLGAFFKFVITEGLARWQLATGLTLLEGAVLHFGRPVQWGFLAFLVIWTFGVGVSLSSACGVAAHALLPVFEEAAAGKIVFGAAHSLAGLLLVLLGTFRSFERIMSAAVGAMFVIVIATAVMLRPDWSAVASGLAVPRIPGDVEDGVTWTLALMGGVGGTLTVICYGYWIREEDRQSPDHLTLCRADLAAAYTVTALFGIAMVIIASGMEVAGRGATLIVDLADRLAVPLGPAARLTFLIGAWAAVFSSLLGVWQAVPYLFADFWQLMRRRDHPDPAALRPNRIDRRGRAYRGYLLFIALAPMVGLAAPFIEVQKLNSAFGAFVMPMIAAALLLLNGRRDRIGPSHRNRPVTTVILIAILAFFIWTGGSNLWSTVAG